MRKYISGPTEFVGRYDPRVINLNNLNFGRVNIIGRIPDVEGTNVINFASVVIFGHKCN